MGTRLLLFLVCVGALHCARASWLSGPRRALAQDNNSTGPTGGDDVAFVAGVAPGTVSVTTPDAFITALLNANVTTIRVASDITINRTRARGQLLWAASADDGVVVLTRSVTIVGISSVRPGSNRSSLALLDFGQLTDFIYLAFDMTLEFRALLIRGMYNLLDDVPSILTGDSSGTIRFSGVVSQRTACLPPAQQLQKIMDAARSSAGDSSGGSKGNNAGLVAGSGGGGDGTAAEPPAADFAAAAVAGAAGADEPAPAEDPALLYDGQYCVPLSSASLGVEGLGGGDGGSSEECFQQPLLLQDFSYTIAASSKIRDPAESALVGGGGGGGGTPGLRLSFNMTIVLCDVFVEPPCADRAGEQLSACVQELLDAKNGRPPPAPAPARPSPPPLPPAPPSPTPPGPQQLLGRGGSRSVPLTVTLIPALLGSLALSAAVLCGIVLWRRRQRRRPPEAGGGGGGAASFDTLQQHDSDQLELGGASGSGPGGGGGVGAKVSDPGAAAKYGSTGGGKYGSAAGTMSSRGLSATTTATTALTLTATPGASPADSGATDPTRSIKLHHLLGSGSFGRVYYGTWQGQGVAVKIIPHTAAANSKVQQEVSLCTRFNHPNVVRSLHCVTFETASPEHQISQVESLRSASAATASTQQPGLSMETWIVLEYCNAGSLASHLSLKAAALGTAGPSGPDSAAAAAAALTAGGAASADNGPGGAGLGSCLLATPNVSLGLSAAQAAQRDAALGHMRGVLSLARDIASGMAYLHSLNVCHGDLKCENVLLVFNSSSSEPSAAAVAAAAGGPVSDDERQPSSGGAAAGAAAPAASAPEPGGAGGGPESHVPFSAKVADFGLSKTFSDVSTHMSTATVGTVTHMCPVLLLTGQMRPSCDVFSFGIMLWQITTGGTPFAGMRYAEIVYKVAVAGLRPEFPPHVPRRLAAVAEACWAADPNARPTFEQLVAQLGELLGAAEELQAEQDAALAAGRPSGTRGEPAAAAAAAALSEEEQRVANQWAAAAAAALLE